MTELFLITGFLGAGKTSFLHRFAPLFPDKRIALIVNEFGANAVDGNILKDIDASLKEIDNGSIFCSCRAEQFENSIMEIINERHPDYIFVEASGLADPTLVRTIFSQPIYTDLRYAGAICLVDAARFHKVYKSSRVSRMQLAISDLVLINKIDIATEEQIADVMEVVVGQKPGRPVFQTVHGEFKREWLEQINLDNLDTGSMDEKPFHVMDITLSKLSVTISGFTFDEFEAFLKMFADETYRIKGFVSFDDKAYLVDCVGPLVEVKKWDGEVNDLNQISILYGKGLRAKNAMLEAAGWFENAEVTINK